MRLSDFLRTWEGHETENRFSRIIILGLLVVCVITSLAAWRTERSIILVPPTLTKEVEVTRTAASSEFKESWGLFLAELLGNTTPANADFLKTAIEPLLAPEIYRTVLDAMTDQIKAIKIDRVAISFTPAACRLRNRDQQGLCQRRTQKPGAQFQAGHQAPHL